MKKESIRKTAFSIIGLSLYISTFTQNNVIYPSSANVINVVTDLGFKNDGVFDNAKKLDSAIKVFMGEFTTIDKGYIMYFPDGTYLIGDSVSSGENSFDGLSKNIHIQGQSRTNTIIRLKDNALGYGDSLKPKSMFSYYDGIAYNNNAFNNTMEDITLHTGNNNPGAIALNFTANNCGVIRNVSVISGDGRGVYGIMMAPNLNGMTLLKNVSVNGFQTGIYTRFHHSCVVMDSISLTNQSKYGIYNDEKPLQINKLHSVNKVPAIYSIGDRTHITLTNSSFSYTGSLSDTAVILKGGFLFARNIQQADYTFMIQLPDANKTNSSLTEFISHWDGASAWKLWNEAPDQSLNLDIQIPEELEWTDTSKIYVMPLPDGSTNHNPMIVNGFNEAVAQGKTHVLFQKADYSVTDTILVPDGIQRITGNWATITIRQPLRYGNKAVFVFRNSSVNTKLIEKFVTPYSYLTTDPGNASYFIANYMDADLIIRDLNINAPLYKGIGKGTVYVENVNGGGSAPTSPRLAKPGFYASKGHKVKARQLDLEQFIPNLLCDSCTLWINGFKVGEKSGPHMVIRNADAEILGGVVNSTESSPLDDTTTIFRIHNSNTSIVCHERTSTSTNFNPLVVEEIKGGETRQLLHANALMRASENAAVLPLFTSVKETVITANHPQNKINNTFFTVYPNPATHFLMVEMNGVEFFYEISDLQGKILQEGKSNGEIYLENISTGIYLLTLKNSAIQTVQKFMIK